MYRSCGVSALSLLTLADGYMAGVGWITLAACVCIKALKPFFVTVILPKYQMRPDALLLAVGIILLTIFSAEVCKLNNRLTLALKN